MQESKPYKLNPVTAWYLLSHDRPLELAGFDQNSGILPTKKNQEVKENFKNI